MYLCLTKERLSSQELCYVWIDVLLQILLEFKWIRHEMTGVCKTTNVMFDNIKALKADFKFLNAMSTMALLSVSKTHKNTWLILNFIITQTFRTFKFSFEASLIQLKQFSSRFIRFMSFEETSKFIIVQMSQIQRRTSTNTSIWEVQCQVLRYLKY